MAMPGASNPVRASMRQISLVTALGSAFWGLNVLLQTLGAAKNLAVPKFSLFLYEKPAPCSEHLVNADFASRKFEYLS